MIVSLRHFLGWLVSVFRSREDLVLENLALRRQLRATTSPSINCPAQAVLGCVANVLVRVDQAAHLEPNSLLKLARHSPRSLPAFSRIDESACDPKPKSSRQTGRNPLNVGRQRFGERQPSSRIGISPTTGRAAPSPRSGCLLTERPAEARSDRCILYLWRSCQSDLATRRRNSSFPSRTVFKTLRDGK